ncbi:MAG: cytochrome c family protein [Asticcacaulis sp.]
MRRIMSLTVVTGLMFGLAACGSEPSEPTGSQPAATPPAPAVAPVPAGLSAEEKAELQAALPAPYNTADLADGQKQWNKCRACHTLVPNGANMVGPNLYGVFGKVAGTHEGYNYSEPMKAYAKTWDFATLDAYLTKPSAEVPGTKMGFIGIKDEQQRHNLIAWLKIETTPKP